MTKLVWGYALIWFLNKRYSMFYGGLEGIRSYTRMSFLLRIGNFYQESKVKYVEDVIIKIDTSNLGMSSKEVIQVI